MHGSLKSKFKRERPPNLPETQEMVARYSHSNSGRKRKLDSEASESEGLIPVARKSVCQIYYLYCLNLNRFHMK